jgi:hypothetical protein
LKRILAILLLCCYTISSNGIYISKHFCGGQLQTISFYKKISKCCCEDETEEMTKEDNCCNDVATFSKLSTDQNISLATIELNNISYTDCLLPIIYVQKNVVSARLLKSESKITIHPPPNIYKQPLFVQHQSWKLDC